MEDKLVKWNGVAMTYDASGNMLTKGSTRYTWTLGNALAAVSGGKNIQYSYDHAGHRIRKSWTVLSPRCAMLVTACLREDRK